MKSASCLYECEIAHVRNMPRRHSFIHRHFMMFMDLAELELLQSNLKLFSRNLFSPYRFQSSDYLSDSKPNNLSLQERVKNFAKASGFVGVIERICLLTNPRFLGYTFNPVSFFFCFDSMQDLVCCVVEVGNTFGEKKCFFLEPSDAKTFKDRQKKFFYVSPFTKLNQDFVFDIALPEEKLEIIIDTMEAQEIVVAASMRGVRLPFTDIELFRLTIRYPFAPLRVIALIHLHALILWLKRVPFQKKELNPEQQIAVLNPHKSLKSNSRR